VRCARANVLLSGLDDRIEIRQGDLFAPVAGERFDLLLFNPPFFRGEPRGNFDLAWRATDVLERFAAGLPAALAPGGRALLLLSTTATPPACRGCSPPWPPRGSPSRSPPAATSQRDHDRLLRAEGGQMSRVILVNPKMCRAERPAPALPPRPGAVLEGRYDYRIVDGNLESSGGRDRSRAARRGARRPLGRHRHARTPGGDRHRDLRGGPPRPPGGADRLGGLLPHSLPDAALNAPYVDYVVRGQGEDTLLQLLERLPEAGPPLDVGNSAAAPGGLRDRMTTVPTGL